MKKLMLPLLLILIILFSCSKSKKPGLTNVEFQVKDNNRMEITYDIVGYPDGALFKIWLEASLDGGNTFELKPTTLTGDAGSGVAPGRKKKITWDVFKDTPTLIADNLVIVVKAKQVSELEIAAEHSPGYGEMIYVTGGEFLMGNDDGIDEEKLHKVYVSDFYMDKCEVTNEAYCQFLNEMGNKTEEGAAWLNINDSFGKIVKQDGTYIPVEGFANHPVGGIAWYGARAFAIWAGKRLPTEAEWEYAARGGNKSKGYIYSGSDNIGEVAEYRWRLRNATKETYAVGIKKPNELEIHDMSGNVWEWCADWYSDYYYMESPYKNPRGPKTGNSRGMRGASWDSYFEFYECTRRYNGSPNYGPFDCGFRCVRSVEDSLKNYIPKKTPDVGKNDSLADRKIMLNKKSSSKTKTVEKITTTNEDMVFIPGGEFLMGSNDGQNNEKPVHKVNISGFYMDKYEVTVAKYEKFVNATGHRKPGHWSEQLQHPNRPVVYVNWNDAYAYAKLAGGRLPTEAEWEYAARGGNTGTNEKPHYKYPWGNIASAQKANYNSDNSRSWTWENAKRYLENVGSYSPNGFGLYDMGGNVLEWCSDYYGEEYYKKSPFDNPKGPSTGSFRVLRGSSWCNRTNECRSADRVRVSPDYGDSGIGFRIVQDSL